MKQKHQKRKTCTNNFSLSRNVNFIIHRYNKCVCCCTLEGESFIFYRKRWTRFSFAPIHRSEYWACIRRKCLFTFSRSTIYQNRKLRRPFDRHSNPTHLYIATITIKNTYTYKHRMNIVKISIKKLNIRKGKRYCMK